MISNLFKEFGPQPFTFGEDGSNVLVYDQKHSEIKQTLAFSQQAILDSFGLDMRTGVVSIEEVCSEDFDVKVAKMKLFRYTKKGLKKVVEDIFQALNST